MYETWSAMDTADGGIEQYEAMMAAIPGGMLIADENFTILFANQGYYDMVGYQQEAHTKRFGRSGPSTLHPKESQTAMRAAREQMEKSGSFSIKARVNHSFKGYIWVHFNGRLHITPKGERRVYIVLVDVSEHLNILEKLENEKSFNEMLSTLSEECFFDCDLLAGIMRYSKNFAQKLEMENLPEDYAQAFREIGLLTEQHKGWTESDFWDSLEKRPEREVRIAQTDKEALWYLCRCAVMRNAEGQATRIVGKLIDITRHKMEIDQLSNLAQRDQLTGLYNKAATESRIKEMLKMRRMHDGNYAWMIIDIDNFKNINDRLGHLYGDVVLTQLAEKLRSLFRADDIVGRAGGDEFFVFLKNYCSIEILREKAGEICALFHKTYSEGDAFVTISASVGIALCPEHGIDFDELYQKADTALYDVKAAGKNAVSIYTENLMPAYTSVRTEIDRNTLTKSFKDNRIEYVFRLLYDSENPVSSIQAVLQLVTESYGFSRGYIFETSADGRFTSNTFEWCAKGICAEISNLQNVPIVAVATANSMFLKTGMFILKSIWDLPEIEREVLEPQGIRSMFQFGIMNMGKLVGFIGFDDCISERIPTDAEIDEICTVCHVLATFLLRHRGNQRELLHHESVEMVMDHMNCFAYVIDPNSYQVLYENQKLASLVGSPSMGKICYTAYYKSMAPCPNCPAARLKDKGEMDATAVLTDKSERYVRLEATRIPWSEGKEKFLLCGVDISEYRTASAETLS